MIGLSIDTWLALDKLKQRVQEEKERTVLMKLDRICELLERIVGATTQKEKA